MEGWESRERRVQVFSSLIFAERRGAGDGRRRVRRETLAHSLPVREICTTAERPFPIPNKTSPPWGPSIAGYLLSQDSMSKCNLQCSLTPNALTNYATQKIPHLLPFFSPSSSLPSFFPLPGDPGDAIRDAGMAPPPEAAARMAARRCFARSSPESAALTYQTLASRGSRRQPMPISVK